MINGTSYSTYLQFEVIREFDTSFRILLVVSTSHFGIVQIHLIKRTFIM